MSFYKRYELDRLIADGDAKTFRALENSSGRAVLLHMFNPQGQPVLTALKSKLAKDPQRPAPPLIELGEFAGSPYVVTEEIAGFRNIREWVATLPGVEAIPVAPVIPAPPAPQTTPTLVPADRADTRLLNLVSPPPELRIPSHPGGTTAQFNSLFEDEKPVRATPPAKAPAPQSEDAGEFTRRFGVPSPAPSQAPPADTERGEFTRMFGTPSPPKPAASPALPQSVTPPPPIPLAPGEFTQVFKLPLESTGSRRPSADHNPGRPAPAPEGDDFEKLFGSAPRSVPEPVQSNQGDEFTGLFGMAQAGEDINIEAEAKAARASAPEARPFQAPSEFTRRFGPQEGAKIAPQTIRIPPGEASRSASRLFGTPEELARKPLSADPPKVTGGPGEYTRIIGTPWKDQPPSTQPAPVNQPLAPLPPPKRTWILWLVIGIPVLALIVVAIIAFMRNR
jgi:hypothetical protein